MKAILLENKNNHSLEYFNLTADDNVFVLDGTVVLLFEGLPTRVTYRVECDKHWRTRAVDVYQERSGKTTCLALKVSDK